MNEDIHPENQTPPTPPEMPAFPQETATPDTSAPTLGATPSVPSSPNLSSELSELLESTDTPPTTDNPIASTDTIEPTESNLTNEEALVSVTPPPRKNRKKVIILASVLGILLAAAGVITYLLFFQPKTVTPPPTDTNANVTTDTPDVTDPVVTAQSLIDKVKASLGGELATTYPSMKIDTATEAPAYKAPGANYFVRSSEIGTSLSVAPTGSGAPDTNAVTAVQTTVNTIIGSESSLTKDAKTTYTAYTSESIVCTVSVDTDPVSVSCADTADYATLVSDLAPFAKAYLASEDGKQYGQNIVMGTPKITEKTDGYKNATIGMGSNDTAVGGYAGLFYAKDNVWTYWTGTQSELMCSEFNTQALQKSFEGDTCYDETTQLDSKVVVTL